MCLRALDEGLRAGARVVDYGCGSGILGIAAARLGAGAVLGVDNDPQAITASADNAERNAVALDQFSVVMPGSAEIAHWAGSADWVVANILAGPLIELAPALIGLLAPGGQLLLAGLLEVQVNEVINAYVPNVPLRVAMQQEEWVLLQGQVT